MPLFNSSPLFIGSTNFIHTREKDVIFIASRDIECPLAKDPENFKKGKVAYIVAENKQRAEINKTLLTQFYVEQDLVKNVAMDQMAKDVFVDPSLPYTQTGGLPTCLELKKFVPVMITVNSSNKKYKENGAYGLMYLISYF